MINFYIFINKTYLNLNLLIEISIKYFIKRPAFIYFYKYNNIDNNVNNFNKFFFPQKNKFLKLLPKINFKNFLKFIHQEFFYHLTLFILSEIKFYNLMKNFRYITFNFNRFILCKY